MTVSASFHFSSNLTDKSMLQKLSQSSLLPTLLELPSPARYIINFIRGMPRLYLFYYGEPGTLYRSSESSKRHTAKFLIFFADCFYCSELSIPGMSSLLPIDLHTFSMSAMHSYWPVSGLDTPSGYKDERWPSRSKYKYNQGPTTHQTHRRNSRSHHSC